MKGSLISILILTICGCATINDQWHKVKWTPPVYVADNATKPVPLVVVPSEPVKPAAAQPDEVSMGFTHPAAVDATLVFGKITGKNIYYTLTGCNWPIKDECQGEAHIGYKRGGAWVTGKMDHFRPKGTSRDFSNVYGGYGRFKDDPPIAGEDVCFMLLSYDKTKRSNAVFTKWIGR